MRLIALVLLLMMCVFKLFLTFRGLDQPAAMEQAQIARSVAQGKGFVTKSLSPLHVVGAAARAEADEESTLNFREFRDSNYAPLNTVFMAVALKLTGMDDFESVRMKDKGGFLYKPDRAIAATSTVFFALAMVLSYMLAARLFDEVVACATVCFLMFSELMLSYAVNGLPQMLMMCCVLGAMNFMLSAFRATQQVNSSRAMLYTLAAFGCMGLLCLSGWMGIWPALGLLLFCCFYFRPAGAYAVGASVVLFFFLLWSMVSNYLATGSLLGHGMLGLYNGFGGGEEMALRVADLNGAPLQGSGVVLRFLGRTFGQLRELYVNMGSIVVVPFFFLALLNPYRRAEVQSSKWAIFSMWGISCVGMALFGVNNAVHVTQLAVIFAPFFVAYGISLVFNFLARYRYEGVTYNQVRGLAVFIMILVSAGPFLMSMPKSIYMGIWLGDNGRPHYPPYFPPALNIGLANISSPEAVIATDQPWAVAWYADRMAMRLPTKVEDFVSRVEPALEQGGTRVQGILITPSSHSPVLEERSASPVGVAGIINNMGDFAPLAMEGKILLMVPRHNLALADLFTEHENAATKSTPLGQLVSSRGRFSQRVPLLGAEMLYYTTPVAK